MLQQNAKIPDIMNEFFKMFTAGGVNSILVGNASNVNAEEFTFDFTSVDAEGVLVPCRMQAQGGFVLVPSDGSFVIIAKSEHLGYFCLFAESVDDIVMTGSVTFNEGANGGIPKGASVTEKLNNIENKVNDLITFINAHIHTSAVPGSPTTTPVPPYSGGTLTPTVESEIVNNDVKH